MCIRDRVAALALIVVFVYVKEPEKIQLESSAKQPGLLDNIKALIDNHDKSGILVLFGILLWFMGFNALETGLSSFAVFTLGMKAGTA